MWRLIFGEGRPFRYGYRPMGILGFITVLLVVGVIGFALYLAYEKQQHKLRNFSDN